MSSIHFPLAANRRTKSVAARPKPYSRTSVLLDVNLAGELNRLAEQEQAERDLKKELALLREVARFD